MISISFILYLIFVVSFLTGGNRNIEDSTFIYKTVSLAIVVSLMLCAQSILTRPCQCESRQSMLSL